MKKAIHNIATSIGRLLGWFYGLSSQYFTFILLQVFLILIVSQLQSYKAVFFIMQFPLTMYVMKGKKK